MSKDKKWCSLICISPVMDLKNKDVVPWLRWGKVLKLGHLRMFLVGSVSLCGVASAGELSEASFRQNLKILASDKFEGRAPASKGEKLTVSFLKERLASYGVKPGNKGSFTQKVPLQTHGTLPTTQVTIASEAEQWKLQYGKDYVVKTRLQSERVQLEGSDLVFAGYGIVAPELGWDDYEGLDVQGKTVVVLINDPGFVSEDPKFFSGKTMTYYGRFTYKIAEAARQGASGILIIHETAPASYPWVVPYSLTANRQRSLMQEDSSAHALNFDGWISEGAARSLFRMAGKQFDKLKAMASQQGFKAQGLNLKLDLDLDNVFAFEESNNVIGVLPGAKRPEEHIIFVAHWDHMGLLTRQADDVIYNGAVDNASGAAGVLELARAFASKSSRPDRTLVFLLTTTEEYGLLGSQYYTEQPVYPLSKAVAVINLDIMNVFGPTNDVAISGFGRSDLDQYVKAVAQQHGKSITPNPSPEKGFYYRSEQFNFARGGVPALFLRTGLDHKQYGRKWMEAQQASYYARWYHTPKDEYQESWDLQGAMEDLSFVYDLGDLLARSTGFPQWYEGEEFQRK